MNSLLLASQLKKANSDLILTSPGPYLGVFHNPTTPVKKNIPSFLRNVKPRPNNIQILKDFSMSDVTQSPSSVDVFKGKQDSSRTISPTKKRSLKMPAATNKSMLHKASSATLSNKYLKPKGDNSLSSILSLAKEEDYNKVKAVWSPKPIVNREKNESIKNQIDSTFTRKEEPLNILRSSKTVQMLQSTLSKKFERSTTFKSMKTSPSVNYSLANSPLSGKFISFYTPNPANCSSIEPASVILGQTMDQEKTPRTKRAFQPFGRKGSDIVDFLKISSNKEGNVVAPVPVPVAREANVQATQKSFIVKPAVAPRRPMTSQKSSRINNGVLKPENQLTEVQRNRLDNFIGTNFNENLTYTNSYLELKVKEEDIEVETLEEAKQYIFEKKLVGNQVHQTMEEYRKHNDLIYMNQIKGTDAMSPSQRMDAVNAAVAAAQEEVESPKGMRRVRDFELYTSETGIFRKNLGYSNFLTQILETRAQEESKQKMKTIKLPEDKQALSQIGNSPSTFRRGMKENAENTQRSAISQLPSNFTEMQKARFKRIRKAVKELLKSLGRLNIPLKEAVDREAIPRDYYARENSEDFIKAAKRGDFDKVQAYLEKDQLYVCEYDPTKQTALHWAAKRGHSSICELLIKKGADIDVLDLTAKTPLYYALREGNVNLVRMLLLAHANPWSTKMNNYRNICSNIKCLKYINRARQISVLEGFETLQNHPDFWDKASENAFVHTAFGE